MNQDIKKTFLKYELVLEKLKTKFNSLYLQYQTLGENNPIEHLKYRIKKIDSIEEKLKKSGYEFTSENITRLNDIVGVRIICSFLNDMNEIIEFIKNDPELEIVTIKDYISYPKESGYSSYHMIVKVPIVIGNEVVYVKAEIQVRTITMDMWASLEHKIWYKKGIQLPIQIMREIDNANQVCKEMDICLNKLIMDKKKQLHFNKVKSLPLSLKGREFDLSMLKYARALATLEDKINTIYEEYEKDGAINPIEHVKGRLKSSDRIYTKLKKNVSVISLENMDKYVNDIAGIRVVCSFRSDLYEILNLLKNNLGLEIIKEKDFISAPKKSGYMGYHLLVKVPVYLKSGVQMVKVEIQVRTIAMEVWASVEHKLCYQKEVDSSIREELKNFSSVIRVIDENMEKIIQESRLLIAQKKRQKIKQI